MTDHDDATAVDAERLADARYTLANHIASGEPLDDWARVELLATGLVTEADLGLLPNPRRCEDPGECYEYTGRRWDVRLAEKPVLVEREQDGAKPPTAMTAKQFSEWLTVQIDEWCEENRLTPHGDGEDLGDLYRELDDAETFTAIGVTLIPAHDEQMLYLVGGGAAWLATTGIELGIENETIWFDPLSNLRLDVPMDELRQYRDRLRWAADEITTLLVG